jgi:uncharacterized integral membrane protein
VSDNRPGLSLTPARVLWVALAIVAVILIAQNSDDTQISVFGWTIEAPLFVVIVAAMLIGWALGTLGLQAWSWRRRRTDARHDSKHDAKHDEGDRD